MFEKLGPYHVEQILGRGGMGTVYVGTHEESGARAAIKALSLGLSEDANLRDRFLSEIETLKKLRHPNIVRMIGDGEQDGCLFYVMELVEGRSLQQELQNGREFSWLEVVEIGVQVCGALKHAHDVGVIHRDLKPANLLCTPDDRIKLTDFGIAKLFGGSQLTAVGSVVGTADYMAPEQADGQAVSYQTDLYSLGTVLFTLLARRPPFHGASIPQVLHKVKYEAAVPIRHLVPDVPQELDAVIAQLLAKSPEKRIPTALVLRNRLRAIRYAFDQGKLARQASRPDDTPTRLSPAQDDPSTEVSPTAVDEPPADEAYAWNEATVVTDNSSPDRGLPALSSMDTVADRPPQNRYAQIDESAGADEPGEAPGWFHHGKTAALALALAAVVGIVVWAAWPPSADQLYAHITSQLADSGPEEAKWEIDRFLERFPQDPRAGEVRRWQMDVECSYLQSQLALRELQSGGSDLRDFEQMLLDSFRLLPDNLAAAEAALEAFLQQYGHVSQPSDALARCVRAARHRLQRVREQLHAPASGDLGQHIRPLRDHRDRRLLPVLV